MAIPTQRDIELPLLFELEKAGGEARPSDLYDRVRKHFPQITSNDLDLTTSSGENVWTNRVQWARMRLVLAGEIDRSVKGVWKITDKGRKRLGQEGYTPTETKPEAITLEDLIAAHNEKVRSELRSKLEALAPRQFELFAGRLLTALGFKNVEVTGKSKDGGVDGFGQLKLGLVTVSAAFQCKRWSSNVSKPDIDKFRGAISGKYDYGIYVATSGFSKGALEESVRPGSVTIQMVDGDMVVDLMMQKGLGVKPQPLTHMTVDDDFFVMEED